MQTRCGKQLDELREVVCLFFACKVDKGMDRLWDSGEWSLERMGQILKEDVHASCRHKYAE